MDDEKRLAAEAIQRWVATGNPVQEVGGLSIYADWLAEGVYRCDYETDTAWIEQCWQKNGSKGILNSVAEVKEEINKAHNSFVREQRNRQRYC